MIWIFLIPLYRSGHSNTTSGIKRHAIGHHLTASFAVCCVWVLPELSKMQLGKTKFGRSFQSSDDIQTLHEWPPDDTTACWAVKIKTVKVLKQNFPELVERGTKDLVPKIFIPQDSKMDNSKPVHCSNLSLNHQKMWINGVIPEYRDQVDATQQIIIYNTHPLSLY